MSARPSPGLPAIVLDRKGATPLYRQIYESYRTAILDRRLRAGQRMPSTRALADELGLSRIPVLNAFEQLIAEGYLEARTGAGTYVSESLPLRERAEIPRRGADPTVGATVKNRRVARVVEVLPASQPWLRGVGAFAIGHAAIDHFPYAAWSRLLSRHAHRLTARQLRYGPVLGYEPFREAVAAYLRTTRAMHCEAG
jgi:GntR family transcriptional regulator/MocR family aminotransferase